MNQRGRVVLGIALAMFVLFILPIHLRASESHSEEYFVCQATPDSPAKRKCVKKILPWVKGRLFDHQENMNATIVIQWEDYLGIKDSDYQRVVAMLPIIAKANEIEAESRGKGMSESAVEIQKAGYYDSVGPEWKKWADKARRTATSLAIAGH